MELRLRAVKNDAPVIKQFYKPKQKKFFKFKFDYKLFLIYMYDPLIFDLMTPISTQFIGSARNIHILSMMVIHPSVLMIM